MDLIPINTDTNGKQTVNARDLHGFLEVSTKFADWITRRVKEYGFREDLDFTTILNSENSPPLKEYHITIDMAKELSMVEKNDKGRQARKYFIEMERRAKDPMAALNDPAAMRQILLTYTEKVISLKKTVDEQAPKVKALDRIATAHGSMCITDAAKHLQVPPRVTLIPYLSQNGWMYKRAGNKNWIAYTDKIKRGFLEHKVYVSKDESGLEKVNQQVLITPKGIAFLSTQFETENPFGG